jgi:hypothetical protein
MLKRKLFIKDIELGDKKAGNCFTDESYIVVAIPSYKEKSRFMSESQKIEKGDDIANFELLAALVSDVSCYPLDDMNEEIKDFDNLLAFSDGQIILEWLMDMVRFGFVPKKS